MTERSRNRSPGDGGDRCPNAGRRLRMRGPLRLLASPAPWLAVAYLGRSMLLGTVWFVVATTLLVTGGTLSIMWLGLPVLAAALAVTRALAGVERRGLALVDGAALPPPYRPATGPALPARLRSRLRDPATRRDATLLVAVWPALFVLDTAALALWVGFAGMVTVPAWYRYVPQTFDDGTRAHGLAWGYFPNGPHGPGGWGVFVDDLPTAFATAAVGAVLLVLVGNYAVVAAARAHAAVTRLLLREWRDPLADARAMLATDPELPTARSRADAPARHGGSAQDLSRDARSAASGPETGR